uniref:AlNc14C65G4656 protein n=1 Tax=Albugo laibachii Nc14 TaxID=890382 RepID=F0WDD6_9STRA|nr:AlNc14C65G4656 [Albugo laibachii Nc14]|eukprot:CCA19208.1 AlNc14C65G4656 [Albugo laibachii Nc14]
MLIVVLVTIVQASFAHCIVKSTSIWNKTPVSRSIYFMKFGRCINKRGKSWK